VSSRVTITLRHPLAKLASDGDSGRAAGSAPPAAENLAGPPAGRAGIRRHGEL